MSSQLRNTTLVMFACPAILSAITHGPIAGILPALYASEFGLDIATIGAVLLIARIFDAVTDPLMGFISDKTVSKYGRRKPWFVLGSFITLLSCYMLFTPGSESTLFYFLAFSILLYLGWTVMEIPYAAWALELSRDSKERARINGFRAVALFIGGIIFTVAPSLIPEAGGRMTFEVLGVLALGAVILIPLTTIVAVTKVPEGEVFKQTEQPKISELWGSVKSNLPFQRFVIVYIFVGIAGGVSGVLSFMYMDSFLQLGSMYTQLFIVPTIISPIVLPIWVWLLRKFDKYRVTSIAFTFYACIMPIPWFIAPGESAFLPMVIYYSALAAFMALLIVSMPTILGDIVDYDELNTGKNRTGQYYSFLAIVTKGTTAVGGPLALLVLGYYGYQPGAENSESATTALRVVANILPAILVIPGVIALWTFPLNDKKHNEIKVQLEAREAAV